MFVIDAVKPRELGTKALFEDLGLSVPTGWRRQRGSNVLRSQSSAVIDVGIKHKSPQTKEGKKTYYHAHFT